LAIIHQIRPKFKTRNDQIVAELFETAGATPPGDPETTVKRKAAEIAIAMALLHGGDWRAEIDHQAGFVLVAPQLPPSA
jgi:hypothetical protein